MAFLVDIPEPVSDGGGATLGSGFIECCFLFPSLGCLLCLLAAVGTTALTLTSFLSDPSPLRHRENGVRP